MKRAIADISTEHSKRAKVKWSDSDGFIKVGLLKSNKIRANIGASELAHSIL